MSSSTDPIYFELSWAILSTIGIASVLCGCLVCGITSFSPVVAVPIFTSAAGAVANGLCYYAFYTTEASPKSEAIASVFADLLWMVQEAGLSFYSYVVLRRVLRNRRWLVFSVLFWTGILSIAIVRIMIAVKRSRSILAPSDSAQHIINHLHISYFVLVTVTECNSFYFLLSKFASAKTTSLQVAIKTGLLKYLMRSTEVRVATLSILGIMRAVTYSFQASSQSATNAASQLDRFAYTMECLFPFVLYIDILASKLVITNQVGAASSRNQQPANRCTRRYIASLRNDDFNYSAAQSERVVEIQEGRSRRASSQEQIMEVGFSGSVPLDIDMNEMDASNFQTGINKTVDFEISESYQSKSKDQTLRSDRDSGMGYEDC